MKTYELAIERSDKAEMGGNFLGVVVEVDENDVRCVADIVVSDSIDEIKDLTSHWNAKLVREAV